MANELSHQHIGLFEKIRQTDENGNEFWSARDLSKVLEYSEFRHFLPVIERGKEACINSGQQIADHFEDILEMITTDKTEHREIEGIKLSRYACYLIVQNADHGKEVVALGQTYFANLSNIQLLNKSRISKFIYTIEGQQIILDRDLAMLYQTDTRTLKQAVKRNIERFPSDFMFELSEQQIETMVSQLVIPSKSYFGGAKPFAFTEQGVAMLSAVLRTSVAVEISLQIIRAFVEMRKMINNNALILQRIDRIEIKQIETEQKFEQLFQALEQKNSKPQQGVFYKDSIFDAHSFVCDLIRQAQTSVILIDNYVDDTILTILSKRKNGVRATIYTSKKDKQLELDIKKYNSQYPEIMVIEFKEAHDRFLIIYEKELYHFGASLKDLGKKWFAFSRMDSFVNEVLAKLKNNGNNE
uniref:Uncharacterized protein n=1 Tax=Chlorobium chlorochromatii (strain CaD3) TaxID=340177 RepID=Q3ARJ2_CHLCH